MLREPWNTIVLVIIGAAVGFGLWWALKVNPMIGGLW